MQNPVQTPVTSCGSGWTCQHKASASAQQPSGLFQSSGTWCHEQVLQVVAKTIYHHQVNPLDTVNQPCVLVRALTQFKCSGRASLNSKRLPVPSCFGQQGNIPRTARPSLDSITLTTFCASVWKKRKEKKEFLVVGGMAGRLDGNFVYLSLFNNGPNCCNTQQSFWNSFQATVGPQASFWHILLSFLVLPMVETGM